MAKIKIFLDTRHMSVKTKEAPLKIAITHRSRNTYIPLNITVLTEQWDAKSNKVIGHIQRKEFNAIIKSQFVPMESALLQLSNKMDVESMTVNEIRDELLNIVNPEKTKAKDDNSFLHVYERFMEHKTARTKGIYDATLRRIVGFAQKSISKLTFEKINMEWLHSFNDYLAKTSPSANARAIHMRNIRAVFNYAIDNEITTCYPFRRFKIKGEPTKKRNFNVETLRKIFNATNLEPWQVKYRDLFKLTFMLIGINFIDLCNLTEYSNGRIEYVRAKTKKLYSIKLEPEIEALIAKYRGEQHLLNYLDTCKSYRHFYNNVCKGLKSIKDELNKDDDPYTEIKTLTTYWARHSWATIAASLDIPKDTIAAALGHGGNSVTDIYIEFDRRKVDEANRRVLNWVLYNWEDGYAPEEEEKAPKKQTKRSEKRLYLRSE